MDQKSAGDPPLVGMALGLVHVPRACVPCDRVWLASTAATAVCPHCARAADVVPGESYQAADEEQFQRVESALRAGRPSPAVCQRLFANLSDVHARSQRPARLLGLLTDAVPELQFLQTQWGRQPAVLTRALGMLTIVLGAHLRAVEASRVKRVATGDSSNTL
ncbi:MAG: hypothetical protein EOO73_04720 [Myxococcales bacterium]|nr:MAG: hypothetical protein EOO73_04720 [Myxococcales bacterium]